MATISKTKVALRLALAEIKEPGINAQQKIDVVGFMELCLMSDAALRQTAKWRAGQLPPPLHLPFPQITGHAIPAPVKAWEPPMP